jgi:hypothetical protein
VRILEVNGVTIMPYLVWQIIYIGPLVPILEVYGVIIMGYFFGQIIYIGPSMFGQK